MKTVKIRERSRCGAAADGGLPKVFTGPILTIKKTVDTLAAGGLSFCRAAILHGFYTALLMDFT